MIISKEFPGGQWLGSAVTAVGPGLIPGQGTRSHKPKKNIFKKKIILKLLKSLWNKCKNKLGICYL